MNAQFKRYRTYIAALPALLLLVAGQAFAQAPADRYENSPSASDEGIPVLTQAELVELVGPIALYPDDLLAIVLPASTYPLQLVEAARFLEDLENDSSLQPDEGWDDSVVALTNYPEVIELLNEDLDWTWQLGEAVVAQQADVIVAIESFRDRAYAAGNLRSDEHQNVTESDGVIEIAPVEEDVIYVPYYEPERVVVYQPRPVYYYYPQPYPVYYYPYPYGHTFHHGYFWGVTTAFTIGWLTDSVHVYHHSYHNHPYYGHHYYDRWWYRSPSIHVHNSTYVYNTYYSPSRHVDNGGDYWHPPGHRRRLSRSNRRITASRYYTNRNDRRHDADTPGGRSHDGTRNHDSRGDSRRNRPDNRRDGQATGLRERNDSAATHTRRQSPRDTSRQTDRTRPNVRRNDGRSGSTDVSVQRRDRQHDVTIARRSDTVRRSGSHPAPQGQTSTTTVRRPSSSSAAQRPVQRAPRPTSQPPRSSQSATAPRRQPQQSQASNTQRTQRSASDQGTSRSESRRSSGRDKRD